MSTLHHPTRSILATALAALPLTTLAAAPEPIELRPVVVTATRFAEAAERAPNITVINRADIERNPSRYLPDVLKGVAGLDVHSLYGALGIDGGVDIRGSGEAAASNTLVLIDGQRLNPVDSGSIKWETIPLAAVRQIEIQRGSSSVLYGDRAVHGVINIITDQSGQPQATVQAEAGSHGLRAYDAVLAGSAGVWSGRLFAHDARTDGWRRNNDAEQTSVGGRAGLKFDAGNAYLDFSSYREDFGLPSSISRAQFDSDPQQTNTPRYRMQREGWRVRPGLAMQASAGLLLEIDGSYSDASFTSKNPDWFMHLESRVTAAALSPRVKWTHTPGQGSPATSSETVAGLDFYDGEAINDDLGFTNRQTGRQQGRALYAENRSQWGGGYDSTVGLRRQQFEQALTDQGARLSAASRDDLTAWELAAGWRFTPGGRLHAKLARNFRLPTTDELFAYDTITYQAIFNGALKAQTGRLVEVGLGWEGGAWRQQFTLYQQQNHNEIGYIAANGRNANLDPTRRRGMDWEGRLQLSAAWQLLASVSWMDARFSSGAYDGKLIPLVPRHHESLGLRWDGGALGSHSLDARSVGSRAFGSDFANARARLGGHLTLDYRAQWRFKPFSVVFKASNLTDERYATLGYSSATNPGTLYPAEARTYSLALRYDL